ncbi:MAG: archaellin/type IV pilin N-terminal domain-containing protein [Candidatus Thorarchaeota archaeon]
MKKGITPIIAIIVLLLITIALAGAAWTFMSQYTGQLTSKNIQMIDAYCQSRTNATVVLKNIGTDTITVGTCSSLGDISGTSATCGDFTISRTDGAAPMDGLFSTATALAPGSTLAFTDAGCTVIGTAQSCSYRFLVGGVAPVPTTVTCSG